MLWQNPWDFSFKIRPLEVGGGPNLCWLEQLLAKPRRNMMKSNWFDYAAGFLKDVWSFRKIFLNTIVLHETQACLLVKQEAHE